ncbi:hypothetical protein MMC28_002031 [Mycoblastus sanguinarius]|nr:hypothetical protein [Mycoblastus sanguinarius]
MSVEGPHTSVALPEFRTSQPNVCPTKCSFGLDLAYIPNQQYTPTTRSDQAGLQELNMPVSTSSQSLLASLPSFMSVFGNGIDKQGASEGDSSASQAPFRTVNVAKRPNNISHFSSPIFRRDSASTFGSTESSPTTTISTVESSLTEPSPSSSPESPNSQLPLLPFKTLRTNSVPGPGAMDHKDHFANSFPTLPGLDRADSPNKKMRNMKNLSVNTTASNRHGPHLPKLALSNTSGPPNPHAFSAPPTPAFIVPPKAPRKKPSSLGLTISTPDSGASNPPVQDRPSAIPQTPSDPQIRTLRMLQTSSSGPLFSPTVAPEGGMRLPPFSNSITTGRFGKSRPPLSVSPCSSFDTTVSSPVTKQTLEHVQEETDYELPLSQEVKSPAYPQGPVCIYDPHVYLYLEPSHIEALEFDVVLNVAREVKNPFIAVTEMSAAKQMKDADVQATLNSESACLAGRDSISEPQTAASDKSFTSAFEAQPDDAIRTAPSTPKASRPQPEYIHVPWDHNTNVVDDLLRLCELIDNRIRQGKRVLVHCQCGVSRSASLVVAYGLYKSPRLTVQEAYDAVKSRSRWIGPNMNLIYQLSEFKSKLSKMHQPGTSAWHSWRSLGSGRANPNVVLSPDLTSALPPSSLRIPPQKSLSAPSPMGRESAPGRANSFSNPPGSAQLAQGFAAGDITPGPSSAPPDMQWSPSGVPSKPETDAQPTNGDLIAKPESPPRLIDTNAEVTRSPSTMDCEAIEDKEVAPAGGVANDLQEVAKNLNDVEHTTAPMSPPGPMDVDNNIAISPSTAGPAVKEIDAAPKLDVLILSPTVPAAKERESAPKLDVLIPSPTLPAGFSSLLSRRQGPLSLQQLPFRQEPTRLTNAQLPPRAFDPDVPPTPSLLSPRAAEFTASPFHRTAAGDLAGSSVFEQGLMSPGAKEEDPRSPHQRGEAPITRSIFDMI